MQKKANTHLLLFTALLWRLPEAVFWLMLFNALGDPEDAMQWLSSRWFKGFLFYT